MLKNFKKIIATVAALAIASSSFVAMAATYPDVTPDASYYAAVEQLSALGMIEGFDDGTFKAEEKVTRAQMAKLVVGAKNLLAAAESNTTQKFDDVKADHWAVGYVAEGVAQGIINGTSETTFDPDATVTFAQATKMLVNACGYEEYAQIAGGWPNGYLTWGSELGINKDVTGVGNDTELTRGQVAQMIANAIKAPILKVDKYVTSFNGDRVPEYKQMNGEDGKKFESLLTNEWDTYEVYGRVTATSRKSTTLKAGEVNYRVEKSDNYNGVKYTGKAVTGGGYDVLPVSNAASGKSGAEDLYLEYTYALIQLNEDDEASIVYIESAGKNEVLAFTDELVVPVASPTATPQTTIDLYKSATTINTKQYKLADGSALAGNHYAQLIVNGVEINDGATQLTQDDLYGYLNGSFENACLIDSPQAGQTSTDGYYDYITLDVYRTDVVAEVFTRANGDVKVVTDGSYGFTVVADDEDTVFNFALTDGTALEVTDLKQNDVLSIQADPNFAASSFYNVIVSRDTAEGKVTGSGTDAAGDTVYTVGDAEYKFAAGCSGIINMLTTYTLYLDKDGNIAKNEVLATSVNYAIVDRYFTSAGETKVRLILKDGSKADYAIKAGGDTTGLLDADATPTANQMIVNNQYPLLNSGAIIPAANADTDKVATQKRFVEYSVNNAGEVTLKPASDIVVMPSAAAYNERSSRIGSYAVADTSVILNAADFASNTAKAVTVADKGILVDEMPYLAAFLGQRSTTDGSYPMVVMLTGNTGYTKSSELQVATNVVKTMTVDGTVVDAIPVSGADLILASNAKITGDVPGSGETDADVYARAKAAIDEGVAFVAATNSAGEVEEFTVILDTTDLANNAAMVAASYDLTDATYLSAGSGVQFAVAPVIKKYATGIELAQAISSSFNTTNDTGKLVTYATDAKAYCYDGVVKEYNRVTVAESLAEVSQSVVTNAGKNAGDSTKIDWNGGNAANNQPAFAVVRMYDNDVQEVYSIVLQ